MRDLQPKKKAFPTSSGTMYLNPKEIVFIEADGSYARIVMENKTEHYLAKNLKEIEGILNEDYFFRPHKSFIINTNHIKKYTLNIGGEIEMIDGSKISLSRRKKDEFIQIISK